MSELTDEQIAQVDANVAELAEQLAGYVGPLVFEFEAGNGEPWGDAKDGDKYHSEQLYSSSYGPSASTILWGDVGIEDPDDEGELLEEPEWSSELCDDLQDQVTSLLQDRFPDHENVFAYWEDNVLMVVVSEA